MSEKAKTVFRNLPFALIIRDGWGISRRKEGNAIFHASTPFADYLFEKCPTSIVQTSGFAVGLPKGYQGNSEVGHITIGAGRIHYQSLQRINSAIENRSFFDNEVIKGAFGNAKKNNAKVHLMGLLQDQGVHAHIDHLFALLDFAKKENFRDVIIHIFTDGRDTAPKSALSFLKRLELKIKEIGIGKIGMICGRFYAMDRDNRWERIVLAYKGLVDCEAPAFPNACKAIKDAYSKGETDEFIMPRIVNGFEGIKDKDSVIFYNYRYDRARELTTVFMEREFNEFPRTMRKGLYYACFTKYYDTLKAPVAFEPISMNNLLGQVISKNGLRQLRIAETEKYAHVTFFFNGQSDVISTLESHRLIASPKVTTYDLKPEMSAYLVCDEILASIKRNEFDVYIINFANPDMVGHTGVFNAAVMACEVVDECVRKVCDAILDKNGCCLVGADHGNAEEMIDDKLKEVITSHTLNPVYYHLVSKDKKLMGKRLINGGLCDIAPTILDLIGVEIPKDMTGISLLEGRE
ncbi:MAG TPA: 2,3-bisphosphoglycerate-independent phosphoglycerate mutase [Candidatus Woesearchaeota archaeon]|nr:2,3-bisphosphoglycerate-independent phosphoglycerate mutase [Candidatus Woesearchaeota archaeon]